jgi:tetratricopeptide (TPR) repeat protein
VTLDPKTVVDSLPLLAEAARQGFVRFKRWREPDNFARLTQMLELRFQDHVFLYGQDWTFLRDDAEAVGLLDAFFVSQSALHPGLVEVVAAKLSVPSDAAPPLPELAEEVVAAIESLANELWHDEADRIIFELRRLVGPLDELPLIKAQTDAILARLSEPGSQAASRVVSFQAAPDDIRPHLERLAEEDATMALKLYEALLGGPSVVDTARNLIASCPPWTLEGVLAGRLWKVLGAIAAKHGAWEAAEQAYLRAAEVGYGRRANVLAKAAEAASARGNHERGRELLEAAAREDSSDAAVAILQATSLEDGDERLDRLAEVVGTTPEETAAVFVARATAHLMKGRYNDAADCVTHALELAAKSLTAREMSATVALFEGRQAVGGTPDVPKLREAAQTFLDLRATLMGLGRHPEAARLLGRAVEASYVAGEMDRARDLLEEAASDERLHEAETEARVELAEHAMTLWSPDLARRLLPPDAASEAAELFAAPFKPWTLPMLTTLLPASRRSTT